MILSLWLLALAALCSPASAFCGFYAAGADTSLYNSASMVVLAREGHRTVVSMQNNYEGPPKDFALVIPVPHVLHKGHVRPISRELFDKVDTLSAPRLVEYWEQNPCPVSHGGGGDDFSFDEEDSPSRGHASSPSRESLRREVKVVEQFEVAEYDISILSARDSGALEAWLHEHGYRIPEGAAAVLEPYVASGMKFFVARVDVSRLLYKDGKALLTPLRFDYDSDTFSLPVRLGLLNSSGAQDLIVAVLAKDRYELANYKNALIPTNIKVKPSAAGQFGALYDGLFDLTAGDAGDTVVTEYSWLSTTCDPCPTPPLAPDEVAALGGEVLRWDSKDRLTLTRLHYRYTTETLGEDLVFRQATALFGGRGVPDGRGELTERHRGDATVNQFQGRYVMLHPWEGPVRCAQPRRGVWGGDPHGGEDQASTAPSAVHGGPLKPASRVELIEALDQDLPLLDAPEAVGGCSAAPVAGGLGTLVALAMALRRRRA